MIPDWLVGRWRVPSRLAPEEAAALGPGVVEVLTDSLAHHSFARSAQIFDQRWPRPRATIEADGLVRLDADDVDEVWLDVRARDGDRIVAHLGGVDVLPWGRELPLVRIPEGEG